MASVPPCDMDLLISPLQISSKDNFSEENSISLSNLISQTSLSEAIKYLCSYQDCNKLFGKKDRLVVHERVHSGERPFKCSHDECDKSYTRKLHLTRHITVCHSQPQEASKDTFICEKCNKCFSNIYSLKKHTNRSHSNSRYSCTKCLMSFKKQRLLKFHAYRHTFYKCDACKTAYPNLKRFNRHLKFHKGVNYSCTYENCLDKFDSYAGLRGHLNKSHPKVCDICGKTFDMLCRLRRHFWSHQEIREAYFCPFTPCERYYFEENNLRSHICMKHDSSFKGFQCSTCDKSFVTKHQLQVHQKTHEPNKIDDKCAKKPRKTRKGKGIQKKNLAEVLSGFVPTSEALLN